MLDQAFKNVYTATNVPKLRSFQYRLLHRAVITNVLLQKWRIVESSNCTFCNDSIESYVHLFVNCEFVQPLWEQVKNIYQELTEEQLYLCPNDIICGTVDRNKPSLANYICLLTKQYIYKQRCLKQKLSLEELCIRIYYYKNIEKFIATKNNCLEKFRKKWPL